MQRANKEGHRQRMVEVRYIIIVGACFLAVVGLMAHFVCYDLGVADASGAFAQTEKGEK
jgi:hypothetical protein